MITGSLDIQNYQYQDTSTQFDYVQGSFHKSLITGLDVCVRKQLIVTCSLDKTVNVWNYETCKLEISHAFAEECLTVAFHPSGLHLVVALQDKVHMCNILSRQIMPFKSIPIKQCSEIRFANGGHLFACAVNPSRDIYVYNFYTTDGLPFMQFTGHVNKVKSIDWFADDLGFSSCGLDGNVYFYDLYQTASNDKKDPGKRNDAKDFVKKEVKFSGLCNVPGRHYEMFAVGSDGKIHSNVRTTQQLTEGNAELDLTCQVPAQISQLSITRTAKNLIAGVGEASRPGAIQVWYWPNNRPLDKTNEIQAHSRPIERLRLTHDNRCLFSVGGDGMLCFFEVREGARGQKFDSDLRFSNEILTENAEMEKYMNEKVAQEQEKKSVEESNKQGVEKTLEIKKQSDEITTLQRDIEANKMQNRNKIDGKQTSLKETKLSASTKQKQKLDK